MPTTNVGTLSEPQFNILNALAKADSPLTQREILVERQIRQLHEAGITNIALVVGYKKEYFFYLADKYGVDIVVNREYATRNNNGSLWLVKDRLDNTYVCSSDDYFTTNPFEPYVYKAYYSANYVEGPTDEWCIKTGPGDRITGATVGGADAWVMLGHVYFDRVFSATFREILEQVYHLPETVSKLWESIYLDHIKSFDMVIRRYPDGVIHEFDSVDELRSFDPLFMENVDSEVFDHIADTLGCAKSEIRDFYPLKQGITNLSCHFAVGDNEYVYRHPGIGTEKIVDRSAEFKALRVAAELGIDDTFIAGDPEAGWKISRFVWPPSSASTTRSSRATPRPVGRSRASCATYATWTSPATMSSRRPWRWIARCTPPAARSPVPSTLSPRACATRASSRPLAPSTSPDTLSCATRSCG